VLKVLQDIENKKPKKKKIGNRREWREKRKDKIREAHKKAEKEKHKSSNRTRSLAVSHRMTYWLPNIFLLTNS